MAEHPFNGLARVTKGVLLLRLAAAALSIPALVAGPVAPSFALLALIGVLAGSLVPLLTWQRAERLLLRHPAFLGADLLLAVCFLAVTGVEAPFVVATLGTATLGGLLWGVPGAVLCALLLSTGYVLSAAVSIAGDPSAPPPALLLVIAALYPLLGAAGVGLRRLLDRLHAAQAAVTATVARLSAAEERARIARDLHDSVGKSLHGISLLAHALQNAPPEVVRNRAKAIQRAAETAGSEAREIISGLRLAEDGASLAAVITAQASAWSRQYGVAVEVDADPAVRAEMRVRHELLAILGEALENVARHAQATSVRVRLRTAAERITLEITDDGRGFSSVDERSAAADGHWGLLGMRERAEVAGGSLSIRSRRGRGTTVSLALPAANPSTVDGPSAQPATSAGEAVLR